MQPFFLYYGGKWRLADRLGPPQRDHVIEPFAGSAGYSCFWEPKKVTMIERDPLVVGVWKFLKRVSPAGYTASNLGGIALLELFCDCFHGVTLKFHRSG